MLISAANAASLWWDFVNTRARIFKTGGSRRTRMWARQATTWCGRGSPGPSGVHLAQSGCAPDSRPGRLWRTTFPSGMPDDTNGAEDTFPQRSDLTARRHPEGPRQHGAEARRKRKIRNRRIAVLSLVTALLVGVAIGLDSLGGPSGHPASSFARTSAGQQSSSPSTTRLPAPAAASSTAIPTTTLPPPYEPPPVTPQIRPPIAGEGRWTAMDSWITGPPAILTTTFRPDPTEPGVTAFVAWIRASATQVALYPGYKGPGSTSLDRGPEMVPVSARTTLLATFNSGFYESDAAGGFYTHGTLYFPMIDGLATVVAHANGQVDVIDWTGGSRPGPDVVMARQNLPLMVDSGQPTPAVSVSTNWGLTLHGAPAVWRTALGVDGHSNLIYVAAPDQTAPSLARILVGVGAIRGMQLDINPEWPVFVTYAGAGAAGPVLFVPNPNQISNRFLYPSTKDFFAVYVRSGTSAETPW